MLETPDGIIFMAVSEDLLLSPPLSKEGVGLPLRIGFISSPQPSPKRSWFALWELGSFPLPNPLRRGSWFVLENWVYFLSPTLYKEGVGCPAGF